MSYHFPGYETLCWNPFFLFEDQNFNRNDYGRGGPSGVNNQFQGPSGGGGSNAWGQGGGGGGNNSNQNNRNLDMPNLQALGINPGGNQGSNQSSGMNNPMGELKII